MAQRLATRKPATGLGTAAVEALREARDGVPVAVLRDVRRQLKVAQAVVYVCSAALKHQNSDNDTDVALALQRCVGDVLDLQIEQLDVLIGEEVQP